MKRLKQSHSVETKCNIIGEGVVKGLGLTGNQAGLCESVQICEEEGDVCVRNGVYACQAEAGKYR